MSDQRSTSALDSASDTPSQTPEAHTNASPPLDPSRPPSGIVSRDPEAIARAARFELGEEIARGGMGVVYLARDLVLDRDVGVKTLQHPPEGAGAIRRFQDEARITGQLQHPGIPPVHDLGTLPDGRPFLAMKLIKGRTLDALLKDRGPASPNFFAVFEQIAQAVAYAHDHKVIHRDLKPANVMVGAHGEVQVMDWGLAKVLTDRPLNPVELSAIETSPHTEIKAMHDTDGATQTGSVLGTPAFMPREQAIGMIDKIDRRSDVFGLGAILCTILTGKPPYVGGTFEATRQLAALAKLDDAFVRLDACGEAPDYIALCKKCLAPERDDRPRDAGEVAKAVTALRTNAEQRARDAELERAKAEVQAAEQRKRRKVQLVLSTAAMVILLAGITGTAIGFFREADQRKIAEQNERNALDAAEEERLARLREAEQKLIAQQKERQALSAAEEERKAKLREAEQRAKAEKARDRTRDVLDAMTSEVTGDSLATQKAISAEQKKFLTEVLTYYQEFAGEQADDERSRSRTAVAALKVGLIEYRLGHKEESATAFRMARDGYAALVADFPAVPAYRQELAQSHNSLGRLLTDLGKRAEAEAEYRQALPIQEKLATDFPTLPAYRHELAQSHNNLGILFSDLGKRAEAEAEYRQALAIKVKLAADFPAVPAYRQELATSHNNLGLLLSDLGKRAEAEAEYRQALAIQEKLAADFPSVSAYRQELAGSHNNLGILLLTEFGKRAEAEAEYRQALAIKEKLAADFPSVPAYRRDLAVSYNSLGRLLASIGKQMEAEAETRRALGIQEKLAADFPAVPDYRQDLGRSHNNLGNIVAGFGKRTEAEAEYRQALAIQEKLAAEFPAVPAHRQDLARSHNNLGNIVAGFGKRTEAEAEYRQALTIQEKLAADFPEVLAFRKDVAMFHNNFGLLLVVLGKRAEAEAEYRQALAIREKLAADFPAAPQYRAEISQTSYNFACFYAIASGKRADKKQEYADRGMELLHKAVKAGYNDAANMAKDTDLDPIRDRADFKKLLASLPKPKGPSKP